MPDAATIAGEVRIVTRRMREFPEDSWTLDRVLDDDGYEASKTAVTKMSPEELIDLVKASGLRGRGGAGFPTGTKWSFVPKDVFPKYVVINHDEGEPGTFKDRELAESDPHQVIEGITIAAWAVGANKAFIYCRGEFALGSRRLDAAIREAYERGFLGRGIYGSDFDLDIVLHRGAGAYICGEESALLDSLEGFRGQPRLRPPFPAVKGLYGRPTVINNTETVSTLPAIVANGAEWFRRWGTEASPGTKMLSVSGHVNRPGNYEVPLGISLADVLELAGGMRDDRPLKAVIPGGASAPLLTSTDIAMDFEALKDAGTMLGSGAIVFMDDSTCMVRNALVTTEFFEHESCGKCTPCREGTWWAVKVLERLEHGEGRQEDLDLLLDICDGIDGRSFCPLGDAASWALRSNVKLFRDEFAAHVEQGRCPFGDDHHAVAGRRASGVGLGDAGIVPQPASGITVDLKENVDVEEGGEAPGRLDQRMTGHEGSVSDPSVDVIQERPERQVSAAYDPNPTRDALPDDVPPAAGRVEAETPDPNAARPPEGEPVQDARPRLPTPGGVEREEGEREYSSIDELLDDDEFWEDKP